MKILYMPKQPDSPKRPTASADSYPLGTVVLMEDNSIWKVEWDNQDKRQMWVHDPYDYDLGEPSDED